MFNFGFGELVVILILALIIFGPGKLPQVGAAIGKGLSEFKKAARGLHDDLTGDDAPPPPRTPPRKNASGDGDPKDEPPKDGGPGPTNGS